MIDKQTLKMILIAIGIAIAIYFIFFRKPPVTVLPPVGPSPGATPISTSDIDNPKFECGGLTSLRDKTYVCYLDMLSGGVSSRYYYIQYIDDTGNVTTTNNITKEQANEFLRVNPVGYTNGITIAQ